MQKDKKKSETRIISLFDDSGNTYEIKKHSSIIQMSNVTTVLQRKTFNALLYIANEQIKLNGNKKIFEISIGELKNLVGHNLNNKHLKLSLKAMQSTRIEYNVLGKDKIESWGVFNLLARVQTETNTMTEQGVVKFEFPTIVMDHITNPRLYAKLNLILMKHLDSKHTIALYEVLKDYQNIGKLTLDLKEFRNLMAIKDHQYKSVFMLKVKVIDVAIEEINQKTDINVSYVIKKSSRAYSEIVFQIKKIASRDESGSRNEDILSELMKFGLSENRSLSLMNEYSKEYLYEKMRYVNNVTKKGQVKNPTGLLITAIEDDYVESVIEEIGKKDIDPEAKKQHENFLAKQEREKQEQEEFYIKRDKRVEEWLNDKNEDAIKTLLGRFEELIKNSPVFIAYKKQTIDHPSVKRSWYNFIGAEFLPANENDYEVAKAGQKSLFG